MTEAWNITEAKALKARGLGYQEIGDLFGMSYYMVRSRLDPEWLEMRKAQVNKRRRDISSGARSPVRNPVPELIPDETPVVETGPFTTPSGLRAYRSPVGVSLAYVSMQHGVSA